MKKRYKYSNTVISGLDRDPPKLFVSSVEIERILPTDPPELDNRPIMAVWTNHEPQYPKWIKHYFWLFMGFVWGLLIIALLMEVL